jgi:hypothetical protein
MQNFVFHVAELFRNQHPDEFRTLTKIPATFQKIHYNRYNSTGFTINDKEYRSGNQKWITQRNWQHRVQKTKMNKAECKTSE